MRQECLRFAVCIILCQPVPPDLHSGCGNADQGVAAHNVRDSNPEQHHVYLHSQSINLQSHSKSLIPVCYTACMSGSTSMHPSDAHSFAALHQLRTR